VKLRGAHVLITGASRGIGWELALRAAARSARVTTVARSESALTDLAQRTGGGYLAGDLSDPEFVGGMIDRVEAERGPIDVLVNNAALCEAGEFLAAPRTDIMANAQVNLITPMSLTHQLAPRMLVRGHGSIVTMSSISSEISVRNLTNYGASKAGLTAFMLNIDRELRRTPVHTLLVVLGAVDTETNARGLRDPVISAFAARAGKLGYMPPVQVADRTLDAVERERRTLVLPRAAWPMFGLRQLPNRLLDLAMRGVP
jgi:short-subunit dehydrogenase